MSFTIPGTEIQTPDKQRFKITELTYGDGQKIDQEGLEQLSKKFGVPIKTLKKMRSVSAEQFQAKVTAFEKESKYINSMSKVGKGLKMLQKAYNFNQAFKRFLPKSVKPQYKVGGDLFVDKDRDGIVDKKEVPKGMNDNNSFTLLEQLGLKKEDIIGLTYAEAGKVAEVLRSSTAGIQCMKDVLYRFGGADDFLDNDPKLTNVFYKALKNNSVFKSIITNIKEGIAKIGQEVDDMDYEDVINSILLGKVDRPDLDDVEQDEIHFDIKANALADIKHALYAMRNVPGIKQIKSEFNEVLKKFQAKAMGSAYYLVYESVRGHKIDTVDGDLKPKEILKSFKKLCKCYSPSLGKIGRAIASLEGKVNEIKGLKLAEQIPMPRKNILELKRAKNALISQLSEMEDVWDSRFPGYVETVGSYLSSRLY